MTIGEAGIIELLRSLTSASPDDRESGCGTVTDWVAVFDLREAQLIGSTLSMLAAVESDLTCRESELHALSELLDTGAITADVLNSVNKIDERILGPSELEHIEYLRSSFKLRNKSPKC